MILRGPGWSRCGPKPSPGGGEWCTTGEGLRTSPDTPRSVALVRTGPRHITPHAFRHFAATHLLDQGWAPLQVARFLGHANDALVRSLYANHIVDTTQKEIGRAASRLIFRD
ncbi:MAG: site-specific integrase [Actinomycetota bacterium]